MPDPQLDLLLLEVRALRAEVRALAAGQGRDLLRLSALLVAVYAFGRSSPWTVGEMLEDARAAGRRDVLEAVDAIVGAADPARSLGRFLQRHEGVEAAGLRLDRAKRLWIVSEV